MQYLGVGACVALSYDLKESQFLEILVQTMYVFVMCFKYSGYVYMLSLKQEKNM